MTHKTRIGVGLLCLLAITGVAVGQSAAFTFATTAGEAQAGEDVTVTFTYENTGEETDTAVINVTSIPDGWTISDRSNDGGTWSGGDRSWLYISVPAGSSVSPSLTLSVPADASGTYNVSAAGSDDSERMDSTVTFEFGTAGGPSTETATDDTSTETTTDDTSTGTAEEPSTETTTDDTSTGTAEEPSTETTTDDTSTGTATDDTSTGTADEGATDNETAATGTTGGSGPGFGVVVTGLAVLCLGLLARRRR